VMQAQAHGSCREGVGPAAASMQHMRAHLQYTCSTHADDTDGVGLWARDGFAEEDQPEGAKRRRSRSLSGAAAAADNGAAADTLSAALAPGLVRLSPEELDGMTLRAGVGATVPMRAAMRRMYRRILQRYCGVLPVPLIQRLLRTIIATEKKMLSSLSRRMHAGAGAGPACSEWAQRYFHGVTRHVYAGMLLSRTELLSMLQDLPAMVRCPHMHGSTSACVAMIPARADLLAVFAAIQAPWLRPAGQVRCARMHARPRA
jgi:hypothetical protein